MACEQWNFVAAVSHVESFNIKYYIYITNFIIIITLITLASYIMNQQEQ
jgi:hypothetical protein